MGNCCWSQKWRCNNTVMYALFLLPGWVGVSVGGWGVPPFVRGHWNCGWAALMGVGRELVLGFICSVGKSEVLRDVGWSHDGNMMVDVDDVPKYL